MRALEVRDPVGRLRALELLVERAHLVVVHVAVADRSEVGERKRLDGRLGVLEPRAGADHAGDASRQGVGHADGRAAGSGEPGGVDAPPVDREPADRVVPDRRHGRRVEIVLRVARRVVGRHQDPAELFGGGPEELDREERAAARVEHVEDRPELLGRVRRGEIERVALRRCLRRDDLLDDLPARELAGRSGRGEGGEESREEHGATSRARRAVRRGRRPGSSSPTRCRTRPRPSGTRRRRPASRARRRSTSGGCR